MFVNGNMLFYGNAMELVKVISKLIDLDSYECPTISFAMTNDLDIERIKKDGLSWVKNSVDSWYGIKPINSGLSSYSIELVGNYYGGGCGEYCEIREESDVEECLKYLVKNVLITGEGFSTETNLKEVMLFAEIEMPTVSENV